MYIMNRYYFKQNDKKNIYRSVFVKYQLSLFTESNKLDITLIRQSVRRNLYGNYVLCFEFNLAFLVAQLPI